MISENLLEPAGTEAPRVSFHSRDFETLESMSIMTDGPVPKIHGRTQQEWEKEWGITGGIEHLKGLGWSVYQWRYYSPPAAGGAQKPACFAEFFGPYYHGYLRGDGLDVKTSVLECVNQGQKMAKCERKNGHQYLIRCGNGLIECSRCHFNGYSTQVETLMSQVRNLGIATKFSRGRMSSSTPPCGKKGTAGAWRADSKRSRKYPASRSHRSNQCSQRDFPACFWFWTASPYSPPLSVWPAGLPLQWAA